jgi:hypothetical protein
MIHVRYAATAFLIMALAASLGCNSSQDKPGAKSGAPVSDSGEIKTISGQRASGAPAASPQDQADARTAASRILAQMDANDFAAIYKNASPGFQKIGSETAFTAKFLQTNQKTGLLKNPKEMSIATLPNGALVLVYRLENERFISDRRLTFARSQGGQMVLEGLNQHDEPKK